MRQAETLKWEETNIYYEQISGSIPERHCLTQMVAEEQGERDDPK